MIIIAHHCCKTLTDSQQPPDNKPQPVNRGRRGNPPEFLALLAAHPATHGYFTPETLRCLFEESGLEVVEASEAEAVDIPQARKGMGLRALLTFMVQVYPKLLLRLVRDRQIRAASKIDDELTKKGQEYMGYALIVGQKPG